MAIEQYIVIAVAYFLSAFVKGVTGLGFSTTCLGILALAFGVKNALPLVILPSLVSNIITMRSAGHFRETVMRFHPLLLSTVPGLILGLWVLSNVSSQESGAVLGTILIVYTIFALMQPSLTLSVQYEKILSIPAGFFTGLINGMTGSQVMPVLPYLLALKLDSNRFVQAINCSFTLSSLIMGAGVIYIGYASHEDLVTSVTGLLFVYAGVAMGTFVRNKLSETLFRRLVLGVLIILGVGLLVPVL